MRSPSTSTREQPPHSATREKTTQQQRPSTAKNKKIIESLKKNPLKFGVCVSPFIEQTSLSLVTFMHWRRKWQPTPVFLPGESQGWWSLVGCRLWGRTVRHDWSDLAAAAAAEKNTEFSLHCPWGEEMGKEKESIYFGFLGNKTSEWLSLEAVKLALEPKPRV